MISFTLFTLSGIAIATLTVAKRVEEKHKKTFFVLEAISKGDEYLHELRERIILAYLRVRERSGFLLKKQLPLKAKGLWNRTLAWTKESAKKLIGDLRDSRLLKRKPDGISEFFKNISEIEKGNGELHDSYQERVEEPAPKRVIKRSRKILVSRLSDSN